MNKISIPFVKKTTRDFIRQVRAAKTAAEESDHLQGIRHDS